jgi:hypothetical protein
MKSELLLKDIKEEKDKKSLISYIRVSWYRFHKRQKSKIFWKK